MNYFVPTKVQIALTLALAALLSVGFASYRLSKPELFFFEIAVRSSEPGTTQVFYDLGSSFNERDSVGLATPTDAGMTLLRFPLPAGRYGAFRFDPIDHGAASVAFGKARVVDASAHVIRSFSVQDFQASHDVPDLRINGDVIALDLSATNSDPSLIIPLVPPVSLEASTGSLVRQGVGVFVLWFTVLSVAMLCCLALLPRRWFYYLPLLAALATFVCLLTRSRYLAPISWDEGFFMFYGWMVKAGNVPYRDFIEPKPPVIFVANALGLFLFGLKDCLFRIVPTAFATASIAGLFAALIRRRIVLWLSVLLTAQVALWLLGNQFHDTGLNDSETYGFAFTLFGFSLSTFARPRRAGFRGFVLPALTGVCFGLAVLSKELFVFSVVPAWLLSARRADGDVWDWRYLWISAAAGITVGLLFLAYLITHAALASYLDTLRFSRVFAANYCFDIGRFPRVSGLAVLQPSWTMLHDQFYNFRCLAFVLALVLALSLRIRRKDRSPGTAFNLLVATAAVVLGVVAISVGYCFWPHYYLMGTMGLFLLSLFGAETLTKALSRCGKLLSFLTFVALSGLFVFVAKPATKTMLAERFPPARTIPVDHVALEAIRRYSKPGDYILDTDSSLLYVVTNRKSPLPIVGFTDEVLSAGLKAEIPAMRIEHLRNALEEHLPKVCNFSASYRSRQEMYHRLVFDPFLEQHRYVRISDRLWYLPEGQN